MLRMESETGWWLTTHPHHARLAGAFAAAWGNHAFRRPEPRARVLYGISTHDDGWAARDENPSITRQGKPSAFSSELVGKYSAFEEIDIADYLDHQYDGFGLKADIVIAKAEGRTVAAVEQPVADEGRNPSEAKP